MSTVANFHVAGIASSVVSFARQLAVGSSSKQVWFDSATKDRALEYIGSIRNLIEVIGEPAQPLDLPCASYEDQYEVPDFVSQAEVAEIENVIVKNLVLSFQAAWKELVYGQSRRQVSGLHYKDKSRLMDLLANMEAVIGSVDVDKPLDIPEPDVSPIVVGAKK